MNTSEINISNITTLIEGHISGIQTLSASFLNDLWKQVKELDKELSKTVYELCLLQEWQEFTELESRLTNQTTSYHEFCGSWSSYRVRRQF
jgi:hypothetical protein